MYLLLLQLLHLLIFGSYYPFNQSQMLSGQNKRPSSEPISGCSSAPKKTVTQSMMDDHITNQQSTQSHSLFSSFVTSGNSNFYGGVSGGGGGGYSGGYGGGGSLPYTSFNNTYTLGII